MNPTPSRLQLGLVAGVYFVVVAVATALVFLRHLMYLQHAQDAAAAGGMYAAGDWMLELFIGCMLLVPTLLLMLITRNSEKHYLGYSKVMLGLSVTAPISLGVISIPAVGQSNMLIGWMCMDRLFCSPVVLIGLVMSRLLARFDRAKRLTLYALLIEVLTLFLTGGLFVFA